MKDLRKNVFIILILGALAFACAAFSGCKMGAGVNGKISENPYYPYDGVSSVYASELTVSFAKESDCPDDVVDESKFFSISEFDDNEPYLMVIDLSFGTKTDNSGTSVLYLSVSNTDAESLNYYVVDAETSDIKETTDNNVKTLSFGFKVPEKSGLGRKTRIIVRLTPIVDMYAEFKTEMSVTDGLSISGKTAVTQNLIATPYGLKFESVENGYAVTGRADDEIDTVVLPKTYKGNTVTAISRCAFQYWKKLKSISIPDGVTSIGDYAFMGSGLTSISIPEGVTSIGDWTFDGCGLTSISIPDGVTSIGVWAFGGCRGLTSITIPNSVTSIGYEAFSGCIGLTSVYFDGDIADWCNISFYGEGANPIFYAHSLSIKDRDEYKLVTELIIPDGVTSIGNYLFYDCSGLTSITIPDSVTWIGEEAFAGCSGLTSITIPDSVTSIGDSVFYYCRGLTSITIPDRVTSIGDSAFYYCRGLTSITIPDSVKSIGAYAFSDCTGLTSITIPDSVTSIGNGAFKNCDGLTSITISDSVTSIGDRAFSGCSGLNYNEYKNLYYLGNDNNPYLVLMKPKTSSVTSFEININTKFIYYSAFSGCSGLTSITIPAGVTSIGSYAFENCDGLTSITIPDSVTSIGDGVFSGCRGLRSITIPDSVTSIGDGVFSGCIGLRSITIPDSVKSIGAYAFSDCTGLTSITIPDSATSIGNSAFSNCSGLTSITFGGTKKQWKAISKGSRWKENVPSSCVVHCTDGDINI